MHGGDPLSANSPDQGQVAPTASGCAGPSIPLIAVALAGIA